MQKNLNLYELLGLHPSADASLIKQAYLIKLQELEGNPHGLDPTALAAQRQKIQIAHSTLQDSASRKAYDAMLATAAVEPAASQTVLAPPETATARLPGHVGDAPGLSLMPQLPNRETQESAALRADALALRAESLSLRADSLVMKSQASTASMAPASDNLFVSLLTGGAFWRILIFFALLAGIALGFSRCATAVPPSYSSDNKAAEKAALQEYFQTHGVRPANMAELEQLEAERRRRENVQRNQKQDTALSEREFEEESRRRGKEVADQLRQDQLEHQRNLERIAQERKEAERIAYERNEAEKRATESRMERQRQQWQDIIRR
ncbi:MAG: J domain-containing protein [Brachymonas sp.]